MDITVYRVHDEVNGRVRLLCGYLEVLDQQCGNVGKRRAHSLIVLNQRTMLKYYPLSAAQTPAHPASFVFRR